MKPAAFSFVTQRSLIPLHLAYHRTKTHHFHGNVEAAEIRQAF